MGGEYHYGMLNAIKSDAQASAGSRNALQMISINCVILGSTTRQLEKSLRPRLLASLKPAEQAAFLSMEARGGATIHGVLI